MIEASCHCGAVRLRVEQLTETVTECTCSICHRLGAQWAYYTQQQVEIDASAESLSGYRWGDQCIEFMHCRHCGVTTHYQSVPAGPKERLAVNARGFERRLMKGVRVRVFDGADSWRYLDE